MTILALWAVVLAGLAVWLIFPLPWRLLRQARNAGLDIGWRDAVSMRLMKVDSERVVAALLRAHKNGLRLEKDELEAHHLAGGDPKFVVDTMVAAQSKGITLPFGAVAGWDLAGRDPVKGMQWLGTAAMEGRLRETGR